MDANQLSGRWDWERLRQRVMTRGARNSLLLAPMPTASTAQIMGFNECIEPYTSNLYGPILYPFSLTMSPRSHSWGMLYV